MTDKTWPPYNTRAIANNVRLVLKTRNIGKLNGSAYHFITQHMSFIAHYDLYGFQAEYADLRDFVKRLQTSEYGNDINRNLEWAKELETAGRLMQYGEQNRPHVQSEADTIRAIIAVVREYESVITQDFNALERVKDLEEIKRLAAKNGITVQV